LRFTGRDGMPHHVATRLIGAYNLPNALAAVAIGRHFGVADERIAEALAAYTPGNNRSEFRDTGRNQLIMDAYNANPTSMRAALENFAAMPSERPKLAILGDMLELGDASAGEHAGIVALADALGIEASFVGPLFMACAPGRSHADAGSMRKALQQQPVNGRLVLLKGSRGIGLESVAEVL
jgi:UDP-N-acetylmuramoyl-tripeptide--D-alanyl-D-alanine ligase